MCHEYSWTVDQWFSHTPREIAILINQMTKRKKQDQRLKQIEWSFLASIHDKKYDVPPEEIMDKAVETKDDKERDEKIAKYMMSRLEAKEKEQHV